MSTIFQGSMVALVTPFLNDGQIDWTSLEKLINFQLKGGTSGLIICGTTGEAATMTSEEQVKLLDFVVKKVRGAVPVVAGTGSNNTAAAVQSSLAAKEVGVDGILVVTPPYNKPTQDGLIRYYNEIVNEAKLPVILYNVPGRTCCNMLPSTVEKLADNPYIVAIKDATADMAVGSEILERCGDKLTLLSGDDFTALPLLSIGGKGWISVTANILPKKMSEMYAAWDKGEIAAARTLHYELLPYHRLMFVQSNPIPAKAAMALQGLCGSQLRSPLFEMDSDALASFRASLVGLGFMNGNS